MPLLILSPYHLIHDTHIALNNLHNLCGDVFVNIIRYRNTMITVHAELYGSIYGLEEGFGVDAGDDEVGFVDGFGALG